MDNTPLPLTPVDSLVARRLGLAEPFDRTGLETAQIALLREHLDWAKRHSPFYSRHLDHVDPAGVATLADMTKLPFTTAQDLREHSLDMLCVSQSAIERVITLVTSGSTGPSKRLYFTRDDLDSTLDFFAQGMLTMVVSGQRVAAMLPASTPDGVGALLRTALAGIGVDCHCVWPPEPAILGRDILAGGYDCIAGLPAHVLALAEAFPCQGRVQSVLLCSEYIAQAVRARIENAWNCTTFMHYGSTETGLGGGVECAERCGCHMREADLLLEIVDPDGGRPLPDGQCGEIVITTLARQGMPLIRYRSGDMGSLDRSPCACGGRSLRLKNLLGRLDAPRLATGDRLWLADLDEALYGLPEIFGYEASLHPGTPERLHLLVRGEVNDIVAARRTVSGIPAIAKALQAGGLALDFSPILEDSCFAGAFSHTTKRTIHDLRHDAHRDDQ